MTVKQGNECEECPYNQDVWVEEIKGSICEGLLLYGECTWRS